MGLSQIPGIELVDFTEFHPLAGFARCLLLCIFLSPMFVKARVCLMWQCWYIFYMPGFWTQHFLFNVWFEKMSRIEIGCLFGGEEMSVQKRQAETPWWLEESSPTVKISASSWSNIATSHDRFPPNGGLVREIPLFQGNLGWWNIIIWPDPGLWTKNFFNQNYQIH